MPKGLHQARTTPGATQRGSEFGGTVWGFQGEAGDWEGGQWRKDRWVLHEFLAGDFCSNSRNWGFPISMIP